MLHVGGPGDVRLAHAVAYVLTEDPETVALVRGQQNSRAARARLRRNVLWRHKAVIAQRRIGAASEQEPDRVRTVVAGGRTSARSGLFLYTRFTSTPPSSNS
jgi:hypothetical protein